MKSTRTSLRIRRISLGLALRPRDARPEGRKRLRFRASDFDPIDGIWSRLGFLGLLVVVYLAGLIALGYAEIAIFGW